ncbi:MAG: hypothetical protein DBX60_00865, partial [Bacillota bacterium]
IRKFHLRIQFLNSPACKNSSCRNEFFLQDQLCHFLIAAAYTLCEVVSQVSKYSQRTWNCR